MLERHNLELKRRTLVVRDFATLSWPLSML
jgi:hypothetical protein